MQMQKGNLSPMRVQFFFIATKNVLKKKRSCGFCSVGGFIRTRGTRNKEWHLNLGKKCFHFNPKPCPQHQEKKKKAICPLYIMWKAEVWSNGLCHQAIFLQPLSQKNWKDALRPASRVITTRSSCPLCFLDKSTLRLTGEQAGLPSVTAPSSVRTLSRVNSTPSRSNSSPRGLDVHGVHRGGRRQSAYNRATAAVNKSTVM